MATETIYSYAYAYGTGTSWCIERQPHGCTDPMVVSFRKWNRSRSLLNRSARWTGSGWDPSRWVPKPPTVTGEVIETVEAHMRRLQP